MNVIGINEILASLVVLRENAVELRLRVRDDKCAGVLCKIAVEHTVESVEYTCAELPEIFGISVVLRRERRARFLVDQRGVLAQRIVDVLENERGVGVEFAYARHNARDVFVGGFRNAVDYRIKSLRGLEHDVVHAHVLQEVVAEY